MRDEQMVARLSYWANHDADPEAWKALAEAAGFEVVPANLPPMWALNKDDRTVGLIDAPKDARAVAFVFRPWEMPSRWASFWWRIKHPFTPLEDHHGSARVAHGDGAS